jgi:sterol 3beta-glucosyltransferase
MAAIMVLTAGSTGDVEPFVALAELLGKRGHTVTLAADAGFERLAPGAPVEFRPIRADFQSNAVQQAGVRAVIASGWGALRGVQSNSNMTAIETAPHASLFPRVAAVVHHGGAGTTAAGLLAARPTVVCPFQGDQYFWGAAVHRAGAGPQPMPVKKLTPDRLASAIRAVRDDTDMQARAAVLSERIAQENGAGRASEQIESTLA